MCYSAQVKQSLKPLQRSLIGDVDIDYAESLKIFERRLSGEKTKVSRAFEANFADPQTQMARDARQMLDAYRGRLRDEYRAIIETQTQRLAAANSKLTIKPTKTAANDKRVATSKIEDFTRKLDSVNRYDVKASDERIFDMDYAGVIVMRGGQRLLSPMRYRCRREGRPASDDEKYPGCYNARIDNIDRFWRNQFGQTHCLVIVESFWERVKQHQVERRSLAEGEQEKSVELHFKPNDSMLMLVAGIWSHWEGPDESPFNSFAIVTTDAPDEISGVGHDRCPINLTPDAAEAWLTPEARSKTELMEILTQRSQPYYEYEIVR